MPIGYELIGEEVDRDSVSCSSWPEAAFAIDELAALNHSLKKDTIENAKRLVTFAKTRCVAPNEIGVGYWPTIRVIWSEFSIEVVALWDRYEFYHYFQGSTDIEEIDLLKDGFPDELKMLLDGALPILS